MLWDKTSSNQMVRMMCKGTTYDEKIISGQSDHLFSLTDQYLPVRAHNKFLIDQQKGLACHTAKELFTCRSDRCDA